LFILKYDSVANVFTMLGSLTTYPSQGYNHSSALTDDGKTLVFMDEVPTGLPVKVLDVQDLSNLTVTATFSTNPGPTPHNPFMVGNICYIAYYQDGLQVYDVSDPVNPVRIGYFDTQYQTPLGGPYTGQSYSGAWGAYPFLPSGNVLVSDMQNGLYVLDVSQLTGVEELAERNGFAIYPNPVDAGTSIQIATSQNGVLRGAIYDVSGRQVERFMLNTGERTVSLQRLLPGAYMVELLSAEGRFTSRLIVR
jgi:hypothetical protein